MFGVSDGIRDVTRRSGMVRRIRFIYRKVFSGFRKGLEFSSIVLEGSRRFQKVPGWDPPVQGAHMDQGWRTRPTWARCTSPLAHVGEIKGGRVPLPFQFVRG